MAKPKTPIALTVGPWKGMRFTRWSGITDPNHLYLALNCYPETSGTATAYRSRPGRYRLSSTQLGGGGAGQLVYQFTKNTGASYAVCIAGGKFYTFDWTLGTWTETLTAAHLSGAAVTLSSTARCYAVTFNDTMVVSDGINTPWTWDGTPGGGIMKLTNAPVFYGQPTVYVGKLFGIKDSDRVSVVWSEENAANTGYEAGGYANVWALIQQGSDPLQAIRATNEGLYYWRQRSIGVIRGSFGSEFSTTNTFDAVSNLVGTRSPRGVLYYNNAFYFPDEFGRPHILYPGGSVTPIWEQCAQSYPADSSDARALGLPIYPVSTTADDLLAMETVPLRKLGCILFCHSTTTTPGDDTHAAYCFGVDGTAYGVWLWLASAIGVGASAEVVNSVTNLPEVVQVEEDGYTYSMGNDGKWFDENGSGTDFEVNMEVMTPFMGTTNGLELHFDRADIVVGVQSASDVTVRVRPQTSRTPYGASPLDAVASTTFLVAEKRVGVGLNRKGRWILLNIQFSREASSDNWQMGLHGCTVMAYYASDSVAVP